MLVLITGASAGLGRDIAQLLSHRGTELILVARRGDRLEEMAHELPGHVDYYAMDLSKEEQCLELYELVKDRGIDVVINNAGFGVFGAFEQTPLEDELRLIDTNIRAVHMLTKLFLQDFVARDKGYILNIASMAAYTPGPYMAAYYASKAYVLRLTQALREEMRFARRHVYVGAFCPGPIRTEFQQVAGVKFKGRGISSEKAARLAVKGMLRKKPVIIPGAGMKILHAIQKIMPSSLCARVMMFIQSGREKPASQEQSAD